MNRLMVDGLMVDGRQMNRRGSWAPCAAFGPAPQEPDGLFRGLDALHTAEQGRQSPDGRVHALVIIAPRDTTSIK